MEKRARVVAYYLPQFHPIPENDETWGKGFTEWTNVASAKPLWKGHHQPRVPADLGFYDLRLPEIYEQQCKMAEDAGVEGFMFWHYWFGNGKLLLEKPAERMLQAGKPDFPFCFGWANHDWTTRTWLNKKVHSGTKMIAELKYLGTDDNKLHFDYCLPFFKDHRYIKIEGKPIFMIYRVNDFVGLSDFMKEWNNWAKEAGLKGIYFLGMNRMKDQSYQSVKDMGFDGVINGNRYEAEAKAAGNMFLRKVKSFLSNYIGLPTNIYDYAKIMKYSVCEDNRKIDGYPVIMPGYDHTARRAKTALIYKNPTPEAFQMSIHRTLSYIEHKDYDHRMIFLHSWNEWGEGNYMEPDTKWGHAFLDALRDEIVIKE